MPGTKVGVTVAVFEMIVGCTVVFVKIGGSAVPLMLAGVVIGKDEVTKVVTCRALLLCRKDVVSYIFIIWGCPFVITDERCIRAMRRRHKWHQKSARQRVAFRRSLERVG